MGHEIPSLLFNCNCHGQSSPKLKFAAHAALSNLQGLHQGQVSHFIRVEFCKLHPGMPRKKGWFSAQKKSHRRRHWEHRFTLPETYANQKYSTRRRHVLWKDWKLPVLRRDSKGRGSRTACRTMLSRSKGWWLAFDHELRLMILVNPCAKLLKSPKNRQGSAIICWFHCCALWFPASSTYPQRLLLCALLLLTQRALQKPPRFSALLTAHAAFKFSYFCVPI